MLLIRMNNFQIPDVIFGTSGLGNKLDPDEYLAGAMTEQERDQCYSDILDA